MTFWKRQNYEDKEQIMIAGVRWKEDMTVKRSNRENEMMEYSSSSLGWWSHNFSDIKTQWIVHVKSQFAVI